MTDHPTITLNGVDVPVRMELRPLFPPEEFERLAGVRRFMEVELHLELFKDVKVSVGEVVTAYDKSWTVLRVSPDRTSVYAILTYVHEERIRRIAG